MKPEIRERMNHLLNFLPKVSEFLMHIQKKPLLEVNKKDKIDLVTEADIGSEKMLISEIQKIFPNDSILGEESGYLQGKNSFQWILDPVDGTTNFAHGLPLFAIAIGLENTSTEQVEMGIVSVPSLNETFHAARNEGSFLNNKPIRVSNTPELIDSLLCTGFPYQKENRLELLMEYYKSVLMRSRGVRRTGSAALDLSWVACGRFDGFWEEGLKPWDMAAASILIEEAGGKLSTFDGNVFNVNTPNIIATNGKIHSHLVELFRKETI
ncbi:MAG: inositol monophosphatase [Leptospiraceae bacterium]|nr:inositol monophosphatase [Leptospiraceae bacterium]MCK6381070.1 inositol monophosphatase [Leptospiraceae bacterium]NUM42656.1 inositol monophosphatase [Leptospiraceae bacterium]